MPAEQRESTEEERITIEAVRSIQKVYSLPGPYAASVLEASGLPHDLAVARAERDANLDLAERRADEAVKVLRSIRAERDAAVARAEQAERERDEREPAGTGWRALGEAQERIAKLTDALREAYAHPDWVRAGGALSQRIDALLAGSADPDARTKGPVSRLIEAARHMRIEVEHAKLAEDVTGDEEWAGFLLIDQHAFLGLHDALAACEGIEEHVEWRLVGAVTVNREDAADRLHAKVQTRAVATTPWRNAE